MFLSYIWILDESMTRPKIYYQWYQYMAHKKKKGASCNMLNSFNCSTCTCLTYSFTIHAYLHKKHRAQNATRVIRATHGPPQAVYGWRWAAAPEIKAYVVQVSRCDRGGGSIT